MSILLSFSIYASDMVTIHCYVRCGESNIGNANVIFINSKNEEYKYMADFFGDLEVRLPKGKYRIIASRDGYLLDSKNNKIYDFSNGDKYNFYIQLKENTKKTFKGSVYIQGNVYDEENNSIPDATLTLKTAKGNYTIKTDEYGTFRQKISPGIITVLCKKEGFLDGGIARNIKNVDEITNIEIILKKDRYVVEGIITDGTKCLPSIPIVLYDRDLNKLGETVSDNLGHYEFLNIKGYKFIYLTVTHGEYQRYRSEMTELLGADNKINVILSKK